MPPNYSEAEGLIPVQAVVVAESTTTDTDDQHQLRVIGNNDYIKCNTIPNPSIVETTYGTTVNLTNQLPPTSTTTSMNIASTATARPIFRSQYSNPNELPNIVRNMTWYDPLYNNIDDSPNVIAVFDLDPTKFDKSYKDSIFLTFMISVFIPPLWVTAVPLFIMLFMEYNRRMKAYNLHLTHIAMTCTSMYVDKVDEPGSTNIMIRREIKFNDIKSCEVQADQYDCCRNTIPYRIKLVIRNNPTPLYIDGIPNSQKFVDIVNEMKKRNTTNLCSMIVQQIRSICQPSSSSSTLQTNNDNNNDSSNNNNNIMATIEADIVVPIATIV